MPHCAYCTKEFGNEGAKATHENSCPERGDSDTTTHAEAENTPTPADNGGGGAGGLPAQQAGNGLETGALIADELTQITTGSEHEKAQAKSNLFNAAGAAIAKLGTNVAQEKLKARETAKGTDTLTKKEDYPDCPDCGGQITEIGNVDEFYCPHCGVALQVG